ncbi:MAG: hypothetical protein ACE5FA_14235 [Dehalococcoidia bacterium]
MTTKTFDAVKLMRELRDKLSEDMARMAPEDRIRFIQQRAAAMGLEGNGQAGDAAQQGAAADAD